MNEMKCKKVQNMTNNIIIAEITLWIFDDREQQSTFFSPLSIWFRVSYVEALRHYSSTNEMKTITKMSVHNRVIVWRFSPGLRVVIGEKNRWNNEKMIEINVQSKDLFFKPNFSKITFTWIEATSVCAGAPFNQSA